METYRISLRFSRLTDSALAIFPTPIITGMTNNPAFPTPQVPLAELSSLQTNFQAASTASTLGGVQATAAKNEARADLLSALRSEAAYVQSIAKHNLAQLLSSGFQTASRNRAQTQLAAPVILAILNELSGQLTLRVSPIANARNYQVQIQVGDGAWQDAGIYSKARRIEVTNLTPGTIYNLRVRAIGGSTGYSDWSDPTSRMSL